MALLSSTIVWFYATGTTGLSAILQSETHVLDEKVTVHSYMVIRRL